MASDANEYNYTFLGDGDDKWFGGYDEFYTLVKGGDGDDRIIGNSNPSNSPLGTGMDADGNDTTALSFSYLIGGGGDDYIVGTHGAVTE